MRRGEYLGDAPIKIISGGETGVERAALDALITPASYVINWHASYGGWCRAGRTAEDGTIPERYRLRELETGGREEAIERNLVEADGLLIIYFGNLTKCAEEALSRAIKWTKPYRLIDGSEIASQRGAEIVGKWTCERDIERLYVTGPSAREYSPGYDYALEFITEFVRPREG